MKNSMKFLSGAAMLVMFCLVLSSSVSAPEAATGNGTIVEVVKDQVWILSACGEQVQSQSATTQLKDGVVHMRTVIFSLPDDHCLVLDRINKLEISGFRVIVTPGGMAIAKQVFN